MILERILILKILLNCNNFLCYLDQNITSFMYHAYISKSLWKKETEKTNGAKGKTVGCVMKTGCC